MTQATPVKLRSGEWGAKVQGRVKKGDSIQITTKSGRSWVATVKQVVWQGDDGVSIVATESRDRGYGARRGGYRKACVTGGNCSSFGSGRSCGGWDCDGF